MTERALIVKHKVGLHARAAALFVETAIRFKDTGINVIKDGVQCNAERILGVVSLTVAHGQTTIVRANGPLLVRAPSPEYANVLSHIDA